MMNQSSQQTSRITRNNNSSGPYLQWKTFHREHLSSGLVAGRGINPQPLEVLAVATDWHRRHRRLCQVDTRLVQDLHSLHETTHSRRRESKQNANNKWSILIRFHFRQKIYTGTSIRVNGSTCKRILEVLRLFKFDFWTCWAARSLEARFAHTHGIRPSSDEDVELGEAVHVIVAEEKLARICKQTITENTLFAFHYWILYNFDLTNLG